MTEDDTRTRVQEMIRRVLISRRGAKVLKGANRRASWYRA